VNYSSGKELRRQGRRVESLSMRTFDIMSLIMYLVFLAAAIVLSLLSIAFGLPFWACAVIGLLGGWLTLMLVAFVAGSRSRRR